jgi:hypothetical protein
LYNKRNKDDIPLIDPKNFKIHDCATDRVLTIKQNGVVTGSKIDGKWVDLQIGKILVGGAFFYGAIDSKPIF